MMYERNETSGQGNAKQGDSSGMAKDDAHHRIEDLEHQVEGLRHTEEIDQDKDIHELMDHMCEYVQSFRTIEEILERHERKYGRLPTSSAENPSNT